MISWPGEMLLERIAALTFKIAQPMYDNVVDLHSSDSSIQADPIMLVTMRCLY